jgi:hypothetical protein
MGRYLKNTQLQGGSYAIQLPLGSNSIGPDQPVNGQIRFNTSNNRVELFFAGVWNQVAKIGSVNITVDEFTGDGVTTTFTMSQAESSESAILVSIGGVYQQPITNYTVDGSTTITFTSPPPAPGVNPNKIVVVHNLNSTDAA